jgi:hypothetical protein
MVNGLRQVTLPWYGGCTTPKLCDALVGELSEGEGILPKRDRMNVLASLDVHDSNHAFTDTRTDPAAGAHKAPGAALLPVHARGLVAAGGPTTLRDSIEAVVVSVLQSMATGHPPFVPLSCSTAKDTSAGKIATLNATDPRSSARFCRLLILLESLHVRGCSHLFEISCFRAVMQSLQLGISLIWCKCARTPRSTSERPCKRAKFVHGTYESLSLECSGIASNLQAQTTPHSRRKHLIGHSMIRRES